MPLNIMSAPSAIPGTTPPGPPELLSAVPVSGPAALLFGQMLAQTAALPTAKTTGVPATPVPIPDLPGDAKEKSKKTQEVEVSGALMVPIPGAIWMPPVPTVQGSFPVKPAQTPPTDARKILGKVMDTAPVPGGELLSPQRDRVRTSSPSPSEAAAAVPSTVPVMALAGPPLAPTGQPSTGEPMRALPHHPSQGPLPSQQTALAANPVEAVPAPATAFSSSPALTGMPPVPAPVGPDGSAAQAQTILPVSTGQPIPASAPASPAAGVAAASGEHAPALPPLEIPMRTPEIPSPLGLQNSARHADNQTGKNTVGTLTARAGGGASLALHLVNETAASGADTVVPAKAAAKAAVESGQGHAPQAEQSPVPPAGSPFVLTQTSPVTTMPAADRSQMLRQFSQGMETMTVRTGGSGQQQVTLQLHPKDWGQLNVSVTMTPTTGTDGTVTTQVVAHVVAEHPAVKAALDNGRGELRHALHGAGLKLDRLTVTVQAPAAGAETSAGDSRRQSHTGEGGAQAANYGTSTQGGSTFGGSNPPPFAAFSEGQPDRRPRPSASMAGPSVEHTPDDAPLPAIVPAGRWDTRA